MNNKMDYKVIKARSLEGLVKGVNSELKKGWKCQGGVEILKDNEIMSFDKNSKPSSDVYHQAVVK
tara:strand:- start:156 stop:350 length:195 start_codon:yes stop_codon:yes gene_type:complete